MIGKKNTVPIRNYCLIKSGSYEGIFKSKTYRKRAESLKAISFTKYRYYR